MRQDTERRHNEILNAINMTEGSADKLHGLDVKAVVEFLGRAECKYAAAQAQRLRLDGYALASVVDGLGWRLANNGDFLLAQWLANCIGSVAIATDEMSRLLGAVEKWRSS